MTSFRIIVRTLMETEVFLGFLGFILIFVPIIGIWAIHKYDWEHWQPFDKHQKLK